MQYHKILHTCIALIHMAIYFSHSLITVIVQLISLKEGTHYCTAYKCTITLQELGGLLWNFAPLSFARKYLRCFAPVKEAVVSRCLKKPQT